MADALDSKSSCRKAVWVQVPPPALKSQHSRSYWIPLTMPKPVLQAMVLADNVYQDRLTGKHIISGTFTSVLLDRGPLPSAQPVEGRGERRVFKRPPTAVGSPYLYLALVGVRGTVPLELRFVDLSDSKVWFDAKINVTAKDPVGVAEYILPMTKLPEEKAGVYSLDVLHEGEILGSWRVTMVEKESENQAEPETEV